jgi:hypothetical protein
VSRSGCEGASCSSEGRVHSGCTRNSWSEELGGVAARRRGCCRYALSFSGVLKTVAAKVPVLPLLLVLTLLSRRNVLTSLSAGLDNNCIVNVVPGVG